MMRVCVYGRKMLEMGKCNTILKRYKSNVGKQCWREQRIEHWLILHLFSSCSRTYCVALKYWSLSLLCGCELCMLDGEHVYTSRGFCDVYFAKVWLSDEVHLSILTGSVSYAEWCVLSTWSDDGSLRNWGSEPFCDPQRSSSIVVPGLLGALTLDSFSRAVSWKQSKHCEHRDVTYVVKCLLFVNLGTL